MSFFSTVRNTSANFLFHRVRRRPRRITIIGIGVLVIVAFIFLRGSGDSAETVTDTAPRHVEVSRVADLNNGSASISVVGEVESTNEAAIRTEAGGKITRVRSALGDFVNAGEILAEIENSSQRAASLQAEGAFDAAKAALQKIQGGTRDEQLAIKEAAVTSAKGGALTALLSAYAATDSAVNDTADQMFADIELGKPDFTPSTSNQQVELDIEHHRSALTPTLERQAKESKMLSTNSDLKAELNATEAELRDVRSFMDSILVALSNAIVTEEFTASDIAALKSSATSARTALTSALSSTISARASLETAEKNLEEGIAGAVSEDIAAAEASVKQAQGAYNAALANLEKTLIRSPISGTLNNFTIKLGDYVQPSQQVAVVSNNGALEVIAFVTDTDKAHIAVGNSARIESTITGTVTKIAPALDPISRRIEVRIGLPKEASTQLTNGQSARVEIARTVAASEIQGPISVPITALKLEVDRDIVFSVGEDNTLIAHPITIGPISGSYIRVDSGLTSDMEIVVDARGLKEGDTVSTGSNE